MVDEIFVFTSLGAVRLCQQLINRTRVKVSMTVNDSDIHELNS